MTLSDRLDDLRQAVPSCRLVSFGDLATGLALRTSASRAYKQDYLEEVLRQAAAKFSLADGLHSGNDMVVVATPDELRVFVRSTSGNSDILCCVCEDATDIPQAATTARGILTDMAGTA